MGLLELEEPVSLIHSLGENLTELVFLRKTEGKMRRKTKAEEE
jgi:hypothetical protein